MLSGRPALTKPRTTELREIQERFDAVRQRLVAIEGEVNTLLSVANSSTLATQVGNLRTSLQQILLRVAALEAALGVTDTVTLIAGAPIGQFDAVVMTSATGAAPVDPNDPTQVHAAVGVATSPASAGQSVTVQRRGSLTITGASYDIGRAVYAGPAGGLTQDPSYGAYVVPLGVATSASTIWISPALALLRDVGVYSDSFVDSLPITYSLLRDQIAELTSLLAQPDGFVYLLDGQLVTQSSGAPGGGGAVESVNGQIGIVELYLSSLYDVIVDSAEEGDGLVRRSGNWVAEALPGRFTNSSTAPSSPREGDRWFDPDDGILYHYISDGTSSQWVEL